MPRKAVRARGEEKQPAAERAAGSVLARRAGWVALAGLWLFFVAALASFDSADRPSHVVAVHNDPAANLCGAAGAMFAYWAYQVVGVGSWMLLAGLAGWLVSTAARRPVTHPLVRGAGFLLMALGVSCFHGLLLPQAGPLAGSHAGLLATYFLGELSPRFSTFGTFLILLMGFGVGAIVAVDRLVLALPRAMVRTVRFTRSLPSPSLASVGGLLKRRKPALAGAGAEIPTDEEEWDDDGEYEYEYEYEYEDEEEPEVEEEEKDEPEPEEPARPKLTAEQLRQKIAKLPLRMAGSSKTIARDEDIPRQENFEGYEFPTLDLLEDPETNFSEKMESIVRKQAQKLEKTLQTYGIDGEVVGIESGPAVTLYSVQLAPGTKVASINRITSDIARALKAQNIRIVPNMVGKTTVGIEIPNQHREKVRLKELMSGGHAKGMILPMFLGKDAAGEPLVADLTRMPHMLIAGTTGSGKSVCMNSIIMSWLYTKRPDELKLVLVDPKMVEMSMFGDIPHLMCPVVTEASRATSIMEWAVERMEERYELLKEARVRDIAGYNKLGEEELYERFEAETDEEKARIPKKMQYFVFVVDELADMMMAHKEVEHSIVRIAQKARAVGLHLILATQRPQANVVTGLIKSNMPCRVSFKVASGMDSRIVLDQKGAELLLGQGDMMFLTPHTTEVKRAQGTLMEDAEIRAVVKFLKEVATPSFERSLITLRSESQQDDGDGALGSNERDPMFDEAVKIMIESGRGSVSLLQRRLAIGYGRASRLVDQMALAGIVGDHKGSVAREVLISLEEWEQMKRLEDEAEREGTVFEGAGEPAVIETVDDSAVPAEYGDEYRM